MYKHQSINAIVPRTKNLLERGIDPKPILMDLCQQMCVFWKEKLKRCEKKLEKIIKVNPTKSCLYPMRDYVTCVEACVYYFLNLYVQPKIFHNLKGVIGYDKEFN